MNSNTAGDAASYKSRKEAFVSNLSGGTLLEINLVTLIAPAAIFLWVALQTRKSFFTPYTPLAFVIDFLLNVCGILFAITYYSSAPLLLNLLLALPALVLLLPISKDGGAEKASKKSPGSKPNASSTPSQRHGIYNLPRPFLTHYRGGMMVITCLAILAVDFQIFPRRFAKAENWGTSLMDLGVGSFVFSAGVVSAKSLLKTDSESAQKSPKSFLWRFITAVRHSMPLLVLGFVRLYSVKGLDYAEHVTEYGVHWNFFFTLALLPPFVELSDLITTNLRLSYSVLSLIFAVVYEGILNTTSLKSYILVSPRGPSLLSKNREGVFSFIGYLAIFLAGRNNGVIVLSPPKSIPKTTNTIQTSVLAKRERKLLVLKLAQEAAIWTAFYFLSTSVHTFNLTVSRRLANLPYVLWVSAFNNAQIYVFATIETIVLPRVTSSREEVENATSRVMSAFNKNGLIIFLVANLLTGVVNLTVNTLDMSSIGAMGVLIAYAAAVTAFALALDMMGLRIKL